MFSIKKIDDPRKVSESLAICLNEWAYYVDSKCQHWWVIFKDGIWVGYGGLNIFDRETVCLGPTRITEKVRGYGLQRKLIKVREAWARRNSFTRAVSIVAHDNIYSANNLIRSGYILRKPWTGTDPKNCYLYFEKFL